MRFLLAACLGNWGPFFGQIPGCIFRLRAPGKLCPILDAHCEMHFPQLIGATHLSLSPMTTDSKSPAVGADCGAHEERLVCGRFAWRPRERQRSRDYSWMRVPERPAMVSAALSRAPMMQVRPLRERANLMAARTLGSMEPLPNWPSSARRSASSAVRSSSSSWLGLPKLMATCSTAVSRNRTSASQSSASSSPPRSLSMTAGTPL